MSLRCEAILPRNLYRMEKAQSAINTIVRCLPKHRQRPRGMAMQGFADIQGIVSVCYANIVYGCHDAWEATATIGDAQRPRVGEPIIVGRGRAANKEASSPFSLLFISSESLLVSSERLYRVLSCLCYAPTQRFEPVIQPRKHGIVRLVLVGCSV